MDIVVILLIGIGIGIGMLCLYVWVLFQRIRGRVDDMVNQIINEAEADLSGSTSKLTMECIFATIIKTSSLFVKVHRWQKFALRFNRAFRARQHTWPAVILLW